MCLYASKFPTDCLTVSLMYSVKCSKLATTMHGLAAFIRMF